MRVTMRWHRGPSPGERRGGGVDDLLRSHCYAGGNDLDMPCGDFTFEPACGRLPESPPGIIGSKVRGFRSGMAEQ